jgi:hypothetical protein
VTRVNRRPSWLLVDDEGRALTIGDGSVALFFSKGGAEHYAERIGLLGHDPISTTTILMRPEEGNGDQADDQSR